MKPGVTCREHVSLNKISTVIEKSHLIIDGFCLQTIAVVNLLFQMKFGSTQMVSSAPRPV